MKSLSKNLLITGLPGSGKTTLIQKLAHELQEYGPSGFYTEEIRTHGTREGFRLTSLDRTKTGTLAHVDIREHRVGKYGVDLLGFEQFLESLHLLESLQRLGILDEIGKMECLSAKFRELVTALLNAPSPVIATISKKAGGFIDEVKHRPDVHLYEITERNRDRLLPEIADIVRS
jgi:nucleoside-triphosphatase